MDLSVLIEDWLSSFPKDRTWGWEASRSFWVSNGDSGPYIIYNHLSYASFMKSPTTYPRWTTFYMASISEDMVIFKDLNLSVADPRFFKKLRKKFHDEIHKISLGTSNLRMMGQSWMSFDNISINGASSV